MGALLQRLRGVAASRGIEETEVGFTFVPEPGDGVGFNRFVERVIDEAGDDYVALPTTDGSIGYDRVLIIPLD